MDKDVVMENQQWRQASKHTPVAHGPAYNKANRSRYRGANALRRCWNGLSQDTKPSRLLSTASAACQAVALPGSAQPQAGSRPDDGNNFETTEAFQPRLSYPTLHDLPRSYFLGHHAAGLNRMRSMLRYVDLVIECRDARVPFTGTNPLLERTLTEQGARRLICYTKKDLVAADRPQMRIMQAAIQRYHAQVNANVRSGMESVIFVSHKGKQHPEVHGQPTRDEMKEAKLQRKKVLSAVMAVARERWSLTGLRVLVTGMPNVGKSSLLNVLRASGVQKAKVARTGADPGVTRKVGGWVKVIDGAAVDAAIATSEGLAAASFPKEPSGIGGKEDEGQRTNGKSQSEGVYVADTPGVFMPYVPSSSSMLKLALVGAVKDDAGIIHPVTLADYLLFHLNLPHNAHARSIYVSRFLPTHGPTNDINVLLSAAAIATGRLNKGGKPDIEGTAVWLVKRWRQGAMGRITLDKVDEMSVNMEIDEARNSMGDGPVSVTQARKMQKEARKEKSRARWAARSTSLA